jgi:hypothetical protein
VWGSGMPRGAHAWEMLEDVGGEEGELDINKH